MILNNMGQESRTVISEATNDLDKLMLQWFNHRYLDKINIYCFGESTTEREDDKSFYTKYIKDYFLEYNVWFSSSKGKNDVYKTYISLKEAGIDNDKNVFLFFVDKDWSEFSPKGTNKNKIWKNDEIFKTDYYSLENYFLTKNVIRPLIENFSTDKINGISEIEKKMFPDFDKFALWILPFTTIYSFNNYELNKINTNKYYSIKESKEKETITLEQFITDTENYKHKKESKKNQKFKIEIEIEKLKEDNIENKEIYKKALTLLTKSENYEEANEKFTNRYEKLKNIRPFNKIIRGKQALDFLLKYVNVSEKKGYPLKVGQKKSNFTWIVKIGYPRKVGQL